MPDVAHFWTVVDFLKRLLTKIAQPTMRGTNPVVAVPIDDRLIPRQQAIRVSLQLACIGEAGLSCHVLTCRGLVRQKQIDASQSGFLFCLLRDGVKESEVSHLLVATVLIIGV